MRCGRSTFFTTSFTAGLDCFGGGGGRSRAVCARGRFDTAAAEDDLVVLRLEMATFCVAGKCGGD